MQGLCDLAVIQNGPHTLVVFIERADNPGPSVTSAAESLLQQLVQNDPGIDPSQTRFFEMYDDQSYLDGERGVTIDRLLVHWNETYLTLYFDGWEHCSWDSFAKLAQPGRRHTRSRGDRAVQDPMGGKPQQCRN